MDDSLLDYTLRLVAAIICGSLIGAERERRQKSAGVRTHIIVAMASALMMIVSKYGFFDVLSVEGISVDASRIAASVVSAIGFLGAGVIFVRSESALGLTTSAGLWATVGVGIAFGAGMYGIGIISTALMLVVQIVLHSRHFFPHNNIVGAIKVNLTRSGLSIHELRDHLLSKGIQYRSFTVQRSENGDRIFSARVIFSDASCHEELLEKLESADYIEEISIYSLPNT